MVRSFQRRTRQFFTYDRFDRKVWHDLFYTLHFEDGALADIRNGHGFSVERKSECWQYFNNSIKK